MSYDTVLIENPGESGNDIKAQARHTPYTSVKVNKIDCGEELIIVTPHEFASNFKFSAERLGLRSQIVISIRKETILSG